MRILLLALLAFAAILGAGPALAQSIGVVVDRGARTVTVYRDGEVILREKVAVGKPGHATPTGSWTFTQVDINPDWTPPDSDWSRKSSYTPPGHADNPMGRARLIFDRPYSIHGTKAVNSLGKAASHGSIRVSNPVAIRLAELLLREGGSWQGDDWFKQMLANPKRMYALPLERPIPIEVVP